MSNTVKGLGDVLFGATGGIEQTPSNVVPSKPALGAGDGDPRFDPRTGQK